MFGIKLFAILFITFCLTFTGALVFLKGFLLSRTVVEQASVCNEDFVLKADDHSGHGIKGCWMHGRFKRAIIIVIDALKYDFMVFDESLKEGEYAAPFKNKLRVMHDLAKRHPLHTLSFKFLADPPTTTLQRLKGLTTGSLPTFVDAGANFQSTEITEDNIIDQMLKQNRSMTFFGDDTWMSLFPNRFDKHYEFPSFDVKDLHTVDNGILNHFYEEIQKADWDVAIAHFLGVDHCGHRYGPNHEAMRDKLSQMNDVIRNVTQGMQQDTILFVMGDHGMTRTGDHGGDSNDELEAGLFIYSPTQLISRKQSKVRSVSQKDFVPTISLLLGLPIPFSNLGMVIPELFSHCPWWDTDTHEVRRIYHRVKALRLNVLQINRYLKAYKESASDLPDNVLKDLQAKIHQAEEELKQVAPDLVSGRHPDGIVKQFQNIENIYKQYAQTAKETCQEVWAKFDLKLILTGILIILSGVIVSLFYAVAWGKNENFFSFPSMFLSGGALLLVLYVVAHALLLSESVPPLMAFIMSLVIIVFATVCIKRSVSSFTTYLTQDNVFASVLMLMYCCLFFSNSYIVHEDSVCFYLLQSLIAFYSFRIMHFSANSQKRSSGPQKVVRRPKSSKFDVMQFFANPITKSGMLAVSVCIVLRSTNLFYVCREEQNNCTDSFFSTPLSSVDKALVNQRYLFSLASLGLMVYCVRHWLTYYGNMTGSDAGVITIRYAPPVAAVCIGLYWALQALPDSALDALSPWQQAVLAQVVYVVVGLALCVTVVWPLLIFNHPKSMSPVASFLNQADMASVIPNLYNQLKVQLSSSPEDQKPPVVYGLGSVYCASLVSFLSLVSLVLALLLGDGVAPSLALATLVLYLCLEIYSAVSAINQYPCEDGARDAEDADTGSDTGLLFSGLVMLNLLSSTFFYATGHQATIPSIRFESAYTGFYGNFNTMILPGFLIWMNTFTGPVFFALASPLLVTWPALRAVVVSVAQNGERQQHQDRWQGDFKLFNNGIKLRRNMFQLCCGIITISGLKLFFAACAAALHRRHLMVWKIFAPRLVYEVAFFLTTSVCVMLIYLFVLRVDKALTIFVDSLPSKVKEKKSVE
ncbi:hypothetical protein EGW08_018760 [Elysia chlorotica]|uniref:GPI ethanolamine phosphate transferase 3, catalytic subunit n=1 Tax=Elysia chlorotica TaxID=188477 RepID=A0A433SW15_ELYCH|nr:hypothetical protein EGW08_018760 [Elysia chlorotica]